MIYKPLSYTMYIGAVISVNFLPGESSEPKFRARDRIKLQKAYLKQSELNPELKDLCENARNIA